MSNRMEPVLVKKNRSLGTEMLSLNANEVALEKEKKLVDERQYIC